MIVTTTELLTTFESTSCKVKVSFQLKCGVFIVMFYFIEQKVKIS